MADKMRDDIVGVTASGMPKRFAKCVASDFEDLAPSVAWDDDGQACRDFCQERGIAPADSPAGVAAESDLVILDVKSCDTAAAAAEVLEAGTPLYVSKPLANNLANAR